MGTAHALPSQLTVASRLGILATGVLVAVACTVAAGSRLIPVVDFSNASDWFLDEEDMW